MFPDLHGQALLSIGTFCDAGCTATFTASTVKLHHNGKLILEGSRCPPGLWKTQTNQPISPAWQANATYTTQLKSNAIKFLHAACFSPVTETWTKAIDHGFFKSIPLLNSKEIRRLLPKSIATAKGHLNQLRKNVQSTSSAKTSPRNNNKAKEVQHFDDNTTAPGNEAYACIVQLDDTADGKSYSDLTGRFPSKAYSGNMYVGLLYSQDDNAILVEGL